MASPLVPISRLFRFACHEDVTRMPERPGGHHCASCQKTVVDMSALSLEEAIHTVRTAPKSTCVSYAFTPEGNLLFRAGKRARGPLTLTLAAFLAACRSGAPIEDHVDAEAARVVLVPEAPAPSSVPPSAPVPDTVYVPPSRPPAPPVPARVHVPVPASPERTAGVPAVPKNWPSATTTTVEPPSPPPPVRTRVTRPPEPPIRTAGKPIFAAGGLGDIAE